MNKHIVLWFFAGWMLSLIFPPSALFGMFKGVFGSAG